MSNILILLGGEWHDFDGFAAAIGLLLKGAGYTLEVTYDFNALTRLDELGCDLLLSYTCLAEAPAGDKPTSLTKLSDEQVRSLVQWVRRGGAFLAAHAASVVGDSDPALEHLLGGAFLRHPPQCTFQALPLSSQHPIMDGIESFDVFDELYIEHYHPSVTLHMVAVYEQVAYPIVWSKPEGQGRVAHIALGHSSQTWELKPYQRLVLQTIRWLIEN